MLQDSKWIKSELRLPIIIY